MATAATSARPRWLVPLILLGPIQAVAMIALSAAQGDDLQAMLANYVAVNVVLALTLPLVGGAILARHPRHTVGWLLVWTGIVAPLQIIASRSLVGLLDPEALLPDLALPVRFLVTSAVWVWVPAVFPMVTLLPLHFPDGRLPSRGWRWIRALCVVMITVLTAGFLALAMAISNAGPTVAAFYADDYANPRQPVATLLINIGFPLLLVTVAACFASVVVRYRRTSGVERLQIRWVLAGTAVTLPMMAGSTFAQQFSASSWSFLGITLSVVPLPLAIGLAILRFRLYDLDRLVSRAVSWLLLTGALIALYVGSVLALSGILRRGAADPPAWVVATATLVAALAFAPLRTRLQETIDRRLHRSRVDARELVESFGESLRDRIDSAEVGRALELVVTRGLQPDTVAVWIPGADRAVPGARASAAARARSMGPPGAGA